MSKVQLCLCKIILVCLLLQQFQDNVHGAALQVSGKIVIVTNLIESSSGNYNATSANNATETAPQTTIPTTTTTTVPTTTTRNKVTISLTCRKLCLRNAKTRAYIYPKCGHYSQFRVQRFCMNCRRHCYKSGFFG